MKNDQIIIKHPCYEVSIKTLQDDVDAAKRAGYNSNYAFTVHTVQALIDKIIELSEENNRLKEVEQELESAKSCSWWEGW